MARGHIVSLNAKEAAALARLLEAVGFDSHPALESLSRKLPERIYKEIGVQAPNYYPDLPELLKSPVGLKMPPNIGDYLQGQVV